MASLSNYTDLQAAIADYLNRADLATQVPAYFITLAEATLNKAVRSTRMVVGTTLALAPGAFNVAIPADMLEPVYVAGATAGAPLKHASADKVMDLRQFRFRRQGTPRWYAVVGRQIEVVPAPGAAVSLDFRYYQVIPALSPTNAANWLLTEAPELYLYAALMHAQTLLKDEDRVAVMGNLFVQMLTSALAENGRVIMEDGQAPALSFAAGAAQ